MDIELEEHLKSALHFAIVNGNEFIVGANYLHHGVANRQGQPVPLTRNGKNRRSRIKAIRTGGWDI